MDIQKIGCFLKQLRNETKLTQEELAEKFNVSRRTVSRWETGNNMPDIDLLVELSDFYQVELREILNGERKSGEMNEEMRETVLQVAEYSNAGRERARKVVLVFFIVGIAALIANMIMRCLELPDTFWNGFLEGITLGVALGAMIMGILYNTKVMEKLMEYKARLKGN